MEQERIGVNFVENHGTGIKSAWGKVIVKLVQELHWKSYSYAIFAFLLLANFHIITN